MSEGDKLKTAVEKDALLEDEQSSQTAALDDDERPSGRSDAKDPWHGLNDFDEE